MQTLRPISKDFQWWEFVRSRLADTHGIDNTITDARICRNIQKLVGNVLQPLRDAYGKPVHVYSGFRCAELNRLMGGGCADYHTEGMAADIYGDDNQFIFDYIYNHLPHTELYMDGGGAWVHVAFDEERLGVKKI